MACIQTMQCNVRSITYILKRINQNIAEDRYVSYRLALAKYRFSRIWSIKVRPAKSKSN